MMGPDDRVLASAIEARLSKLEKDIRMLKGMIFSKSKKNSKKGSYHEKEKQERA